MTSEIATVETVKPGDEILIRKRGFRLVAETNSYDDGTIVITYFDRESPSYENRARDKSGHNSRTMRILKSIIPLRPGDPVEVIRGSVGAALTERARLEREENERWAIKDARRERAEARQ